MDKVIACDFDGCLCESAYPAIGRPHFGVIEELGKRQAQGDKIILWTCREGQLLDEAVAWCAEHGLFFDAVNENLPERTAYYGNDCRKVGADEYWDDRAVEVSKGMFVRDWFVPRKELADALVRFRDEDAYKKMRGLIERFRRRCTIDIILYGILPSVGRQRGYGK